jgi:hypothetical protein
MFEGMRVKGVPKTVLSLGLAIINNGTKSREMDYRIAGLC